MLAEPRGRLSTWPHTDRAVSTPVDVYLASHGRGGLNPVGQKVKMRPGYEEELA